MDAKQWAEVLITGSAAASNWVTGAQVDTALEAMAAKILEIDRRGLADPPGPGWHRYLQPPGTGDQPAETSPPGPGPYWVIEVYYHGTTPVVAWWEGARWWLQGYGSDNYVTWWAPIPVPPFGEDEQP